DDLFAALGPRHPDVRRTSRALVEVLAGELDGLAGSDELPLHWRRTQLRVVLDHLLRRKLLALLVDQALHGVDAATGLVDKLPMRVDQAAVVIDQLRLAVDLPARSVEVP